MSRAKHTAVFLRLIFAAKEKSDGTDETDDSDLSLSEDEGNGTSDDGKDSSDGDSEKADKIVGLSNNSRQCFFAIVWLFYSWFQWQCNVNGLRL